MLSQIISMQQVSEMNIYPTALLSEDISFFFFVLNLVFIYRYMHPGGLWQR